jgi:hypothetical protein
MKSFALMVIGLCGALSGCGQKVPDVADHRQIVVDGKPLSAAEFLETYCKDKADNDTCQKVRRGVIADSTKKKNAAARF